MSQPLPEVPIVEFILISICIVFSGLFSGSETILTSLSETRIRDMINNPSRWGTKRLKKWLNNPTRMLSSLLVGNNFVNIAGSILASKVAYHYLRSYADAVAIGGMTFLILIFGEVIPKTIGKVWYDRLAPWAMLFTYLVDCILYPVSFTLNKFAKSVLVSIVDSKSKLKEPSITEGEIEHMITLGEKEGVIDKNEGELLHSVLEFKDTIAKEIMIPRHKIVAISIDASIRKALDILISSGHSRIPVYSSNLDNIKGLLYAKDILALQWKEERGRQSLANILRKPPFFVPETKKISELLTEMQKGKVHLAVVVDEFGSTSGLITLEDILEELVGEIRDEYDKEENPIVQRCDSSWEVQAWVSIYELGETIGTQIPDTGEYETLGGFLMNLLGEVPPAGTEVKWSNYKFKILESSPRRISKVLIAKIEQKSDKKSQDGIQQHGGIDKNEW